MKRWLLGLLLLGCGSSALPPPTIDSVQPDTTPASASTDITVKVSAVLPFHADYGAPDSGVDATATLAIGDHVIVKRDADGGLRSGGIDGGVFSGTLPSILAPGDYDVTLVLGDGRQAVLDGGFHVTAGQWPTSYSIDTIGAQKARVPFQITIHANGTNGPTFHGNVALQALRGSVTPSLSDAFDAGVLVQQISLSQPNQNVVITVSDSAGNFGISNAFDVAP